MKNLKVQEISSPIVCTPNVTPWVLILLCGALGAGSLWGAYSCLCPTPSQQRDPSGAAFFIFWAIFILIPSLVAAYWSCRTHVEATEDGLRWRGLGKWRYAPWNDVTDFYLHEPQKGQKFHVVETAAGKLHLSGFYGNTEPFLGAVAARAVHAPLKAWEQLGCRLGNVEPCRFFYSRRSIQGTLALFLVLGFSLPALMLSTPISHFQNTAQTIGLWWAVAEIVMGLLVIGFHIACAAILISGAWKSLKDSEQTVETTSARIVFKDGGRKIEAAWDEVLGYGVPRDTIKSTLSGQYSVRTPYGDFSFSSHLSDFLLLCQIIRHWAPEEASEIKQFERADVLGGESMRWTGGRPGIGNRVFHYKTRINRALLVNLMGIAAMLVCVPLLERSLGLPTPPNTHELVYIAAALLTATAWIFWRYQAARVEMDDTGIVEYSAFGARRMRWGDVKSVTKDEYVTVVHGAHGKIRFWNTIAFAEELRVEIERRCV